MTKTKLILVAAFLVTLVAGFAAGYTFRAYTPHRHDRPWLVYHLDLTPEQRDKMKTVWQEADTALNKISERGRALRSERSEAISALLSGPQALQYEAIQQEFQRKSDELGRERQNVFEQAHAKTDPILTPTQRQTYEELMKSGSGSDRRPLGNAGKESSKPGEPPPAGGGNEPDKSRDQTAPRGGA